MERLERQLRDELVRFGPAEGSMVGIVRAWPKAVGEMLARNAWPAWLQRDGTLLVHTVSSIWAFELDRMAGEVLQRLRTEAGDDAPAALRFTPGPVPEPPAPVAPQPERPRPEVQAEELRELVARAAAASIARARVEPGSGRGF
jgi:hypothetical protein